MREIWQVYINADTIKPLLLLSLHSAVLGWHLIYLKDCVKLVLIFLLGSKLTPAKQEESSMVLSEVLDNSM